MEQDEEAKMERKKKRKNSEPKCTTINIDDAFCVLLHFQEKPGKMLLSHTEWFCRSLAAHRIYVWLSFGVNIEHSEQKAIKDIRECLNCCLFIECDEQIASFIFIVFSSNFKFESSCFFVSSSIRLIASILSFSSSVSNGKTFAFFIYFSSSFSRPDTIMRLSILISKWRIMQTKWDFPVNKISHHIIFESGIINVNCKCKQNSAKNENIIQNWE